MTMNETTNVPTTADVEPTNERRVLSPPTDILENEDGFELRVDLPGADPASIDVSLEQDVLTLRASVKPLEREGFTSAHEEFELASYERKFHVNEPIDADRIEADYKLGVLRVRAPKVKPSRRRIEVNVG